jgi:hypothetical protein
LTKLHEHRLYRAWRSRLAYEIECNRACPQLGPPGSRYGRFPIWRVSGVGTGMKRPLSLITGTAAGAVLIAAVGVSAHTGGGTLLRFAGVEQSRQADEASGARLEAPEPTAVPEPSPKAEPMELPEAADTDSASGAS